MYQHDGIAMYKQAHANDGVSIFGKCSVYCALVVAGAIIGLMLGMLVTVMGKTTPDVISITVAIGAVILPFIFFISVNIATQREINKYLKEADRLNNQIREERDFVKTVREKFAALDKSSFKRFNMKQIEILYALAHAGKDGLILDTILDIWGWDNTQFEYIRFFSDWHQLWRELSFFEHKGLITDKARYPLVTGNHPRNPPKLDCVYRISLTGIEYLQEQGLM